MISAITKLGESRRFRRAFRTAAWLVLAYVVIASLHGLAPQLWARHFGPEGDQGPFRVLLFSLVIAIFIIASLPPGLVREGACHTVSTPPSGRPVWTAWSLRGPPLS